jgi:hypothetical protein
MDSHNETIGDAASTEILLPLKMGTGLTVTGRTTSHDLNILLTTTTTRALGPLTRPLAISLIGALANVVTILIGQVHVRGLVQDTATTGTIVINVHHTELATVIKTEATNDETSTVTIAHHGVLL